jgi:hypothetical protein
MTRHTPLLPVLLLALCGCAFAQGRIDLLRDGKAAATVVVPDEKNPQTLLAAHFLVDTLAAASGARLPIVAEAAAPAGTKIYLGATRAARQAGLDPAALKGLSCVLKASDGNLFLAGNDRSLGIAGLPHLVSPASKKAVHIFLRDYAGVRWLFPNAKGLGTEVPRFASLSCPAELDRTWSPAFDYVGAAPFRARDGYEFNCDHEPSVAYKSYGGHSYYAAVPKEKYARTHPQYFAFIGGVRNSAGGHLCISNREVQDLVYAEMLKWLDAGYASVQLAQTDGYRPCECPDCAAIHPDIGERLWIMHNGLAQRLAKDRPAAKVVILSYGPTAHAPKTIARFGPNVVIELCHYANEDFAAWRGKADEFYVYLYNWGAYHALGYAPKSTPRMIAQQVRFFRDQRVRGLYCCGLGESWGLEGPVYYVFNRVLEDPDCDWETALDGFYRAGFGKAYVPMKQLYDALYAQLELRGAASSWTPTLPGYRIPTMAGRPETHYAYYFPPDLLRKMEAKLARAKELEPEGAVRARIDHVERAFLYVRDLAEIFHLYRAYLIQPDWTTFDLLGNAIKRREANVRDLFARSTPLAEFNGFPPMFAHNDLATVLAGGYLAATLSAPVNWDVDLLRKQKVLPGQGRKKLSVTRAATPVKIDGRLDDPAWAAAETGEFVEIGMGRLDAPTRVRLLYDDRCVYVAFECDEPLIDRLAANWKTFGHDGGVYSQDCVEVFFDPLGNLDRFYHFICSALPNSCYEEAFGLHTDPVHPLYNREDPAWNGDWRYAGALDKEAKRWTVEIAVPFTSLDVPPAVPGTVWKMNLGRERYVHGTAMGELELSLWSPNLERRLFGSFEAMGDAVFK